MEGKIKALDRKLLIRATKTLLYVIPIVGISNRIYILIYGNYRFDFSGFVNFAEGHLLNLVVAFLLFASLFLFLYFTEQFLLPIIFLTTNKSKLEPEQRDKIANDYSRTYGVDFLNQAEVPFLRFEMIGDITFFFMIPVLWLTYWHHWVGYIIIVGLAFLFYAVAKAAVIVSEPKKPSKIII